MRLPYLNPGQAGPFRALTGWVGVITLSTPGGILTYWRTAFSNGFRDIIVN